MKEFRVAKCLDGDTISEFAIFADGSRRKPIYSDKDQGKYFYVDNELNKNNSNSLLRYSFSGRIKDAIDTIKAGNGDCIEVNSVLGVRSNRVVYFLDRKVGEQIRQETLEGWKDAQFAWRIECGYKSSLSGYRPIGEKYTQITIFDGNRRPMLFDTEEAAEQYIKSIINKAAEYAKRLVDEVSKANTSDEKTEIINNIINQITEYTGSENNVLIDFVFDMVTDECDKLKSPDCKLDTIGYKITQCVVYDD